MGQSNMSGRGVIPTDPDERLAPDPRILVFGTDGTLRTAAEPVDSPAGQIELGNRLAAAWLSRTPD